MLTTELHRGDSDFSNISACASVLRPVAAGTVHAGAHELVQSSASWEVVFPEVGKELNSLPQCHSSVSYRVLTQ